MNRNHVYEAGVQWTGNTGSGTSGYTDYDRSYLIIAGEKHVIEGSSDPAFRGDPDKYNPEELLLSSLAACHMLWYLHICSDNGITVLAYSDKGLGTMKVCEDGSGIFTQVVLKPNVLIKEADKKELAISLHDKAQKMCFIANSVNFPVVHEPTVKISFGV